MYHSLLFKQTELFARYVIVLWNDFPVPPGCMEYVPCVLKKLSPENPGEFFAPSISDYVPGSQQPVNITLNIAGK